MRHPILLILVFTLLIAAGILITAVARDWYQRSLIRYRRMLKQLRNAKEGDFVVLDPGWLGKLGIRVVYLSLIEVHSPELHIVASHAFDPSNSDPQRYSFTWLRASRAHVIKAESRQGKRLSTKMLGSPPHPNVQPPNPQVV